MVLTSITAFLASEESKLAIEIDMMSIMEATQYNYSLMLGLIVIPDRTAVFEM